MDNSYARLGDFLNLSPIIRGGNPSALAGLSSDDSGDGIADHGRHFRELALDLWEHKTFAPGLEIKKFDGIGYSASRPPAQRLQFFLRQGTFHLDLLLKSVFSLNKLILHFKKISAF
jgi:hypothetical protein